MEPEKPTCGTCPFWEKSEDSEKPPESVDGWCQRFPPIFIPETDGERNSDYVFSEESWHQPTTLAGSTCGEHPDFPAYIAALKAHRGIANSAM